MRCTMHTKILVTVALMGVALVVGCSEKRNARIHYREGGYVVPRQPTRVYTNNDYVDYGGDVVYEEPREEFSVSVSSYDDDVYADVSYSTGAVYVEPAATVIVNSWDWGGTYRPGYATRPCLHNPCRTGCSHYRPIRVKARRPHVKPRVHHAARRPVKPRVHHVARRPVVKPKVHHAARRPVRKTVTHREPRRNSQPTRTRTAPIQRTAPRTNAKSRPTRSTTTRRTTTKRTATPTRTKTVARTQPTYRPKATSRPTRSTTTKRTTTKRTATPTRTKTVARTPSRPAARATSRAGTRNKEANDENAYLAKRAKSRRNR